MTDIASGTLPQLARLAAQHLCNGMSRKLAGKIESHFLYCQEPTLERILALPRKDFYYSLRDAIIHGSWRGDAIDDYVIMSSLNDQYNLSVTTNFMALMVNSLSQYENLMPAKTDILERADQIACIVRVVLHMIQQDMPVSGQSETGSHDYYISQDKLRDMLLTSPNKDREAMTNILISQKVYDHNHIRLIMENPSSTLNNGVL